MYVPIKFDKAIITATVTSNFMFMYDNQSNLTTGDKLFLELSNNHPKLKIDHPKLKIFIQN